MDKATCESCRRPRRCQSHFNEKICGLKFNYGGPLAQKKTLLLYLKSGESCCRLSTMLLLSTYEDFTSNLHSVNTKAYTFNLVRTSVNSFNSRLKSEIKNLCLTGSTLYVLSSFTRKTKMMTNWFISASTPNPVDTLNYHTKHFNTCTTRNIHGPLFTRANTKTTMTQSILIFQIRLMMVRRQLKRLL